MVSGLFLKKEAIKNIEKKNLLLLFPIRKKKYLSELFAQLFDNQG